MTLEERAKEIASQVVKDGVMDWTDWQDDLADMILSAMQYAQAEAYAKAAKRVEQLSYDIRSLVMEEKP